MIICIAGMHRSGTSMLARILNLCGCYLGESGDLLGADEHNRGGYWENASFVNLNEKILTRLGGSWDLPPPRLPDWEKEASLRSLQPEAELLLGHLRAHSTSAWKDPRNSLTFPFWKSLAPDLKIVHCVRHPLDVAQSLRARGSSSLLWGIHLWSTYNQCLLETTRPQDRVVTHYDCSFDNPAEEICRVLRLLGLSAPAEWIQQAVLSISTSLQHHTQTQSEAYNQFLPQSVLEIYRRLCDEAGWRANDGLLLSHAAGPELALRSNSSLNDDDSQQSAEKFALEIALADKEQIISTLNATVSDLHAQVLIGTEAIERLQAQLADVQEQLKTTQIVADIAAREVEAVHNSRPWKLATIYWRWRNGLKRLMGG